MRAFGEEIQSMNDLLVANAIQCSDMATVFDSQSDAELLGPLYAVYAGNGEFFSVRNFVFSK